MSSAAPAEVQAAAEDQDSIVAILRARWVAIRSGDVGSLPVLIGIIAIALFFNSKTSIFFSAVNLQNLIGQMAGVAVIETVVPLSLHPLAGVTVPPVPWLIVR